MNLGLTMGLTSPLIGARRPSKSASAILSRLGLLSSFKAVYDAADAASYSSGQQWLDTSGNGLNFNLGADGNATASDPTFTGTVGSQSTDSYFAHDGGDYFSNAISVPAWVSSAHKDNATFSGFGMFYTVAGLSVYLATRTQVSTAMGFALFKSATEKFSFGVGNGASAALSSVAMSASMPTGAWTFIGWRLNEATGANGLTLQVNGTQERFTSTFTLPSASDATAIRIGSYANGNTPLPAGSRSNMIAFTDSEISDADLMRIYNEIVAARP